MVSLKNLKTCEQNVPYIITNPLSVRVKGRPHFDIFPCVIQKIVFLSQRLRLKASSFWLPFQHIQSCARSVRCLCFQVRTPSMCVSISTWSLVVTLHLWVSPVTTLYMSQIQSTMGTITGAVPWWTRSQPSLYR